MNKKNKCTCGDTGVLKDENGEWQECEFCIDDGTKLPDGYTIVDPGFKEPEKFPDTGTANDE
jgi:hypothetical protein